MKQYEVIRRNYKPVSAESFQRSVFEEIQCEDPESYIRERCEVGKKLTKKAFRKMAV